MRCLALLLPLLLLAACGPADALEYVKSIDAGDSSLWTVTGPESKLLNVRFVLGPCSGIQPHVHTGYELTQMISGSVTTYFILNNAQQQPQLNSTLLKEGEVLELPAGNTHFFVNNGCKPVTFMGTFPAGTTTQFMLPVLQALPEDLINVFAEGPVPAVQAGTRPFTNDQACLAQCKTNPNAGTEPTPYFGTTTAPSSLSGRR